MYNEISFEEAKGWFEGGSTLDLYSLHEHSHLLPRGKAVKPRCELLYACYNQEDYEGYAFVLYRENGTLYEVNGSHCSCYGLEDQWKPEEVTPEELKYRLERGHLGNWDGLEAVIRQL